MTYTNYPKQAQKFSDGSKNINKRIDGIAKEMADANNILLSCNNKDLLTNRASETTLLVIERVKKTKSKVNDVASKVKARANKLEEERKKLYEQKNILEY